MLPCNTFEPLAGVALLVTVASSTLWVTALLVTVVTWRELAVAVLLSDVVVPSTVTWNVTVAVSPAFSA